MGGYQSKLQAAREANAAAGSLHGKTALVFGGTAGIGRALAERLAAGGAAVTIVGRNEKAGADVVAEMKVRWAEGDGATASGSTADTAMPAYRFIKADVGLMANGAEAVRQWAAGAGDEQPPRLDYVVMCQTMATTAGRTPTADSDGLIDQKLALNYYSRAYLTTLLKPALEATAARDGADVRVLWVLSAGVHAAYAKYAEDPYLKENYSLKSAADSAGFYTDLWMDHASRTFKGVTFVHACPGFVATNWGTELPTVMRGAVRGIQAVAGRAASECAELLGQGLLLPERKGGLQLLGQYGEDAIKTPQHSDAAVEAVVKATSDALAKFPQSAL